MSEILLYSKGLIVIKDNKVHLKVLHIFKSLNPNKHFNRVRWITALFLKHFNNNDFLVVFKICMTKSAL